MNLDSNLYWCVVGIIGGAILSFIISLVFYFIGIKRKRLSYDIETFCIISDKINQITGLEVKYKSSEIDNLFSSTITINNIGNSIIEKQDFAPLCPITISTNGIFLIDQENKINMYSINKANNVCPKFILNAEKNCDKIIIDFDYISKKQSLTYSLFHTGKLSFDGILKDGKVTDINEYKKQRKMKNIIIQIIFTSISAILGVLITILFQYIINIQ